MIIEMLIALPCLSATAWIGRKIFQSFQDKLMAPEKEFFTIGYFGWEMASFRKGEKVPGSDYQARVVLLANDLDERKVEYRVSHNLHADHFPSWVKTRNNYISYVEPWLQKTISSRELRDIASSSGFVLAACPPKLIEEK